VFLLYAAWDLMGLRMAKAKMPGGTDGTWKLKYPKVENGKIPEKPRPKEANWAGMAITVTSLVVLAFLSCSAAAMNPSWLFATTTGVLLLYRFAKEIRTSWPMP